VWETKGRGVDVRVQWNVNDEDNTSNIHNPTAACSCVAATSMDYGTTTAAARAAATLLHELQHQRQLPTTNTNRQDTEEDMQQALTESMQLFQDFCQAHVKDASHFQVRVTSSRGSTGTKCPVWHMDHVPVRWIQALVGPGCMWVEPEDTVAIVEQWNNNEVDDDDGDDDDGFMAQSAKERNHQLIGPTATVHQAAQGEAVMLIGNRWSELALQSQSDGGVSLTAAIHKSPDQLLPWQGRVLLTMDVLYD
jgi:hypothetical protein